MTFPAKMLTKSFAVSLVCLGLSYNAFGQVEQIELPTERGGPSERGRAIIEPISLFFASIDSDGDAIVTETELDEAIKTEWDSFGVRPRALQFMDWSLKTFGSADISPRFLSFDSNFDSVISETEFASRLTAEFLRLDKNGDGRLERSEMIRSFRGDPQQSRGGNEEGQQRREGRRGENGGRRPRR